MCYKSNPLIRIFHGDIYNQLISYPEREFISCRGHLQFFHGGFAETGGIRPTILWVYIYIIVVYEMGQIGFSHHLSRFSSMGPYLDLPYGTYFCRCLNTLELSPFLRKNAVPENKCRCEKLSAYVVGYFRRLVVYFCRWSGIFAAEKRA